MVNFTIEQLRAMMDRPDCIRSLSVIAHVDHGKSTLTDSLVQKAGIIKNTGGRFTDGRDDEKERGITIKSTGVSMAFKYDTSKYHTTEQPKLAINDDEGLTSTGAAAAVDDQQFLINLIDSPGHVDFSSEVTAALRITDGALVVVDCIEGVCVQTETVLRQAMAEKVKPVLMVNKVDRAFLELQMDPEEAYQNFRRAVESVNVVIAPFESEDPAADKASGGPGCLQVNPALGNVAFGSGLQCWGFTLKKFAQMYAAKFGIPVEDLMAKLWGDNFLDVPNKRWKMGTPDKHIAEGLRRAFVQFCLDPIQQLFEAIMSEKTKKIEKMLSTIGVQLKPKDMDELKGKAFLTKVMSKWLPCADALLEMIVMHLPSPLVAQKYRASVLYDGPLDDEAAQAIMACDKNGPLMMYVSKMVPASEKGRFYAFGRVFSGTIENGQKVRILGPAYEPGSSGRTSTDMNIGGIQGTAIMMGHKMELVSNVPCGNNVALIGIDDYLIKTGTLTTLENAHCFKSMKYSVSPVVRVAVDVRNPADLPKLVEGLRRLAKSDPLVVCTTEESGEHIVAGAGELHLEICLKDLSENFMRGAPIKISEPVVSYRETVTEESSQICLSKSANNHNRLFCNAKPFPENLAEAIDASYVTARDEVKSRARKLADEFGMDITEARKIWAFGPDNCGPNMMVDASKGVQYLHEIRDSVNTGFQWAMKEGPIADEPCRGVIVRLLDVTLHADAIHRGAGQVMPTARRVCFASMYTAAPSFMEPFYMTDISTLQEYVGTIYGIVAHRRGHVIAENQTPGSQLVLMKCYLPVAESFGLTAALRAATAGKAFPQCTFHHWGVMSGGSPTVPGTKSHDLAIKIRSRKGLDARGQKEIPPLSHWLDRLN